MSGFDFRVKTKNDLIEAIGEFGFVPLFSNSVPGFSVEEHVDPSVWFSSEDGVWEWKGPVIRESGCAYGKFFSGKAVFISSEWFPDFANYRRNGYDFDALYDDGLARFRDKELYDLLASYAPVTSKELKAAGNYRKGGKKGFDTLMTRLQESCYAVISDFIYETDKYGNRFGWGICEYSTPEIFMGEAFTDNVYKRTPEESYGRITAHLKDILGSVHETEIKRILK